MTLTCYQDHILTENGTNTDAKQGKMLLLSQCIAMDGGWLSVSQKERRLRLKID